jgi:hypothetical protein
MFKNQSIKLILIGVLVIAATVCVDVMVDNLNAGKSTNQCNQTQCDTTQCDSIKCDTIKCDQQ